MLRSPDTALTAPCPGPVRTHGTPLTQAQVEALWLRDRASLLACRDRHGALVAFYADRDGRLRGK